MSLARIASLVGLFLGAAWTWAPPEQTTEPWTGTVSGITVNGTPGGALPVGQQLMLHAWDEAYAEQVMRHGQVAEDGTFVFEDVPMLEGWVFAGMINYLGATYFSEPAPAERGQQDLALLLTVYETTAQDTAIEVDRLHMFLSYSEQGLMISEVYVLSNPGDRAVSEAVELPDGTKAALRFPLPEDAYGVTFAEGAAERFDRVEGGFVDRQPLIPGGVSGSVSVSFLLPYQSGMAYELPAPYPTSGVNVMVTTGSGLTVDGHGLETMPARTFPDGSTFDVYSHDALEKGEVLSLTISGEPRVGTGNEPRPSAMDAATEPGGSSAALLRGAAIGAAVLGLALIGAGIWWWRRAPATEPEPGGDWAHSLQAVAQELSVLEERRARGEVTEAAFGARRKELLTGARALLEEDVSDEEA